MAKFRQVHVDFWQDGFVLDLTPEEKYFYLYLMTNSKTSQCGIYELPKRIIETETGYNRETVEKLLQRFVDYGKVLYNDNEKEIMLLNWIRHNMIKSPKVLSCIKKELENVKTSTFIHNYYMLCKRYGYGMDTLWKDYGEEEEKEQEEEQEEEAESSSSQVSISTIIDYWDQNGFGISSISLKQQYLAYLDDGFTEEALLKALVVATEENKKSFSYLKGILRNWEDAGAKNIQAIESHLAAFKSKKQQPSQPPKRNDGLEAFNDLQAKMLQYEREASKRG